MENTASTYQYLPLVGHEFRTISLLPGYYDDSIRISISHNELKLEETEQEKYFYTQQEVQASLPDGWMVSRTPEGRYYYRNNPTEGPITYEHPDGKFDGFFGAHTHSSTLDFEALSYVWGSAIGLRRIQVVQSVSEPVNSGHLAVTSNLETALRYLRLKSVARTLWIDAICINQQDLNERAAQVPRMGQIYGQARRVVAWLGPADSDVSCPLQLLERLGAQIEMSNDGSLAIKSGVLFQEWAKEKLPVSDEQWASLSRLLHRPWFERVWIIQEISLANPDAVVMLGNSSIPYSAFRRGAFVLMQHLDTPETLEVRLNGIYNVLLGIRGQSIPDLMYVSRKNHASDARDKIFGLHGLVGKQFRECIVPSYKTSYEEVYKEAMLASIATSKRLELLPECFLPRQGFSGPSWVLDWRAYPLDYLKPPVGCLATGHSAAQSRYISPDTLIVKGVTHGAISSIFEAPSGSQTDVARQARLLLSDNLPGAAYPTGEDAFEARLRTICLDRTEDRFPQIHGFNTLQALKESTLSALTTYTRIQNLQETRSGKINEFLVATLECGFFFTTETGYFGVCSQPVQPTDVVCVLLGLYVPMILRPHKNGSLQVIGWCYVHGLMDGEAILGPLPPNWTVHQHGENGRMSPRYRHSVTDETQVDDPRLGPVPAGWRRVKIDIGADEPMKIDHFGCEATGEITNVDPRVSVDELKKRGVNLETYKLV